MIINKDFREFIELLNEHEVKYKLQLEIEGLLIDFISIGDLITAKKASGRLQDLADVEHLKKILDKKGKS